MHRGLCRFVSTSKWGGFWNLWEDNLDRRMIVFLLQVFQPFQNFTDPFSAIFSFSLPHKKEMFFFSWNSSYMLNLPAEFACYSHSHRFGIPVWQKAATELWILPSIPCSCLKEWLDIHGTLCYGKVGTLVVRFPKLWEASIWHCPQLKRVKLSNANDSTLYLL